MERGELPSVRFGRRWLVYEQDLNAYLHRHVNGNGGNTAPATADSSPYRDRSERMDDDHDTGLFPPAGFDTSKGNEVRGGNPLWRGGGDDSPTETRPVSDEELEASIRRSLDTVWDAEQRQRKLKKQRLAQERAAQPATRSDPRGDDGPVSIPNWLPPR